MVKSVSGASVYKYDADNHSKARHEDKKEDKIRKYFDKGKFSDLQIKMASGQELSKGDIKLLKETALLFSPADLKKYGEGRLLTQPVADLLTVAGGLLLNGVSGENLSKSLANFSSLNSQDKQYVLDIMSDRSMSVDKKQIGNFFSGFRTKITDTHSAPNPEQVRLSIFLENMRPEDKRNIEEFTEWKFNTGQDEMAALLSDIPDFNNLTDAQQDALINYMHGLSDSYNLDGGMMPKTPSGKPNLEGSFSSGEGIGKETGKLINDSIREFIDSLRNDNGKVVNFTFKGLSEQITGALKEFADSVRGNEQYKGFDFQALSKEINGAIKEYADAIKADGSKPKMGKLSNILSGTIKDFVKNDAGISGKNGLDAEFFSDLFPAERLKGAGQETEKLINASIREFIGSLKNDSGKIENFTFKGLSEQITGALKEFADSVRGDEQYKGFDFQALSKQINGTIKEYADGIKADGSKPNIGNLVDNISDSIKDFVKKEAGTAVPGPEVFVNAGMSEDAVVDLGTLMFQVMNDRVDTLDQQVRTFAESVQKKNDEIKTNNAAITALQSYVSDSGDAVDISSVTFQDVSGNTLSLKGYMEENDIIIDGADLTQVSQTGLDNMMTSLNGKQDILNSESTQSMTKLQQRMDKYQQAVQTLTNFESKWNSLLNAITQNLRG